MRAEDEVDTDEEMVVSEDQVLVDTEGDESIIEDIESTDADTYLLFTKPVFEEKTSIGKLQILHYLSISLIVLNTKSVLFIKLFIYLN